MTKGGTLTIRTFSRQLHPDEVGPDVGSRLADRFRAGAEVAVLEVLDTGEGIPEAKLGKVFDPFSMRPKAKRGSPSRGRS